jgi:hypothetical protein
LKAKLTPAQVQTAPLPPLHAVAPILTGPWAGQALQNVLTDLLPSQRLHFAALNCKDAASGWGIRPEPKHLLLKITAPKWPGQTIRLHVPSGASERAEWVRSWLGSPAIAASEYQEHAAVAAADVPAGRDEAVQTLQAHLLHGLAATGALAPLADAVWRPGDLPGAAFYIEGASSLLAPVIIRTPRLVEHAGLAGDDA